MQSQLQRPVLSQQQVSLQPLQPNRDPYMQPTHDVYRIPPQWSDPQRISSQLPQWPQDQVHQPNQPPVPPQIPTRDEMIQLQQEPEWPVRPILPVVPSHSNVVQTVTVVNEKSAVKPKPAESVDDTGETEDEPEAEIAKQMIATEAPVPKKKPRIKHRKGDGSSKSQEVHHEDEHVEKRVKEQLRRIKSDMEMEFMDHDGAAERPGGAVLSLTLGKYFSPARK